jgi:hypothetical protein
MKRWRSKHYLIPVQHEPGKQKGYGMSEKGKSQNSFTPGAAGNAKRNLYWPIGRWAGGAVK